MTPAKSAVDADVSAPDQFRKMLEDIRSAFSSPDLVVDVDELWRVLESYRSKASDWAKFVEYDLFKYRRVLVDEDENYNVMLIGWGPGTKSCIHDHSGSHCFMKVSCWCYLDWLVAALLLTPTSLQLPSSRLYTRYSMET